MTEVLSQNEIDALLAALSSGEMDAEELKKDEAERKVKLYDFKRALRFSKDQIRSLSRIHENYARLLTTYFSAQLRTFVQISVASVDQLPYEEFVRSIPNITILNVFHASPLEGRMVMEVNANIAYAMLDRLLGGPGKHQTKTGSLTEIETIVMEKIFSRALEIFHEAWKNIMTIEPTLDALEMNPQFIQIVSPNETVVVISLSTKIGDTTGMINLCLPHVVIEPIIPKLSAQHMFSSQKKMRNEEEVNILKKRVQNARLPVVVDLGYASITLQELLDLSVGDCIELNQAVDHPLVVNIGNKPKFHAQPGVIKGKKAIQINEVIEEGDAEDEW